MWVEGSTLSTCTFYVLWCNLAYDLQGILHQCSWLGWGGWTWTWLHCRCLHAHTANHTKLWRLSKGYTINFVSISNDCTCKTILFSLSPTYLVERHQMGECTLQALGAEAVGSYMYMEWKIYETAKGLGDEAIINNFKLTTRPWQWIRGRRNCRWKRDHL